MYTAYVIDEKSRETLSKRFPPKYDEFIGHHVTIQFGVPANAEKPAVPSRIRVIGYVDNGDGLEALVVKVDGTTRRPDGKTFHVTWSLNRDKFSPKDSNALLESKQFTLTCPIDIDVSPEVLK